MTNATGKLVLGFVVGAVVVLVSGRQTYEASAEEARRDPALVDSFLGITSPAWSAPSPPSG